MRAIPAEKIDFISTVLKVIGHPVRLKIIEALENEDRLNVNEISNYLGNQIEQSLLSHHLSKMKDSNVIQCAREGQFVYYQLKMKEISKLLDCMETCGVNKEVIK
jgi:DNA-binding transcriptional ArsR family regulator